ncbi:MAG TPA: hypothetical protein PK231_02845 [Acidocella sp.]|nr:MAG: hypothetical protein B7Z77_09535 [Acidocella sp. 20-58-15]HQT38336.1 hypothetical protein [Acidocella sp.]
MTAFCKIVRSLGVSVFFALAFHSAQAAQPILSDPLTSWPLNFGVQGAQIFAKNNAVHIAIPANAANWAIYNGFTFTDMDASVTVTPTNNLGNLGGLIFWSTGPNDFFELDVSDTNGTFALEHRTSTGSGGWQAIVPFSKNPAIKGGAANVLRVVTKGNSVTLYINGQSIGSLNLMAPAGGGAVGIEAESTAKDPCDYAFTNLTVSQ